MLPVLLLAGVGAIAALARHGGGRLPPGQNPFDAFPPGVNSEHALVRDTFTGSSGFRYRLTGFGCADGRTYYVAEKRGDVDWLSYFVAPNGQRERWAANADHHEEIAQMLADFQLEQGAVT